MAYLPPRPFEISSRRDEGTILVDGGFWHSGVKGFQRAQYEYDGRWED